MASSHQGRPRHPAPDDEPDEPDEIDELEEWSEADELAALPELEEPVTVHCAPAGEDAFDVRLTLAVGDLDRAAVTAAIEAPLREAASQLAGALRGKRVVVTFAGGAVIPTAAKDLVAAVLPACAPRSVTVQRGYPDEMVFEGEPPRPRLTVRRADGEVLVDLDTSGLGAGELEAALAPELADLAAAVEGRTVVFVQRAGPTPKDALLRDALVAAGADAVLLRVGTAEDSLYDRRIEERVRVEATDDGRVVVRVAAGDTATTVRALETVLRRERRSLASRRVQVHFAGDPPREAIDCLNRLAAKLAPESIALGGGDLLWPPLLRTEAAGDEVRITMDPRSRLDLVAAFQRELAALDLAGKAVTLDWPQGMQVGARLQEMLVAAGPRSLAYTFAGRDKEPFWPAPMRWRREGDLLVAELDTEAGAPPELARAMQRLLRAQELRGAKLDVHVRGAGTVSRAMRQALLDAAAPAAQLRLFDRGAAEDLLPRLLAFAEPARGEVRLAVTPGDRTAAEVAEAAAAELDEHGLPAGAIVRIAASAHDAVVEAVLAAGPARVFLESAGASLQIHPRLFADPEREGSAVRLAAAPDAADADLLAQVEHELPVLLEDLGDLAAATVTLAWTGDGAARRRALDLLRAAAPEALLLDDGGRVCQLHPEVVRTFVDVLARNDAATPPMVLLGVDLDDAAGAAEALERRRDELADRRVLVAFRDGGEEVSAPADHPVVRATCAFLAACAAAVLIWHRATPQLGAHFAVAASRIDGLAAGARMRDWRA